MQGAVPMADEEVIYTPEEVARIIRVHPRTVYRMIDSGKLKAFTVGNRSQRIRKIDLDQFIRGEKPAPKEDQGG